ncbi:hypothetical protein S40288_10302 [Stachybotrys chartarum IBT 40288]|nr:hypothetical protein S40288_10302 [Stachybotrys chartarum IBT 40288]
MIAMSDPQNYTIGWISAIPTESVAARQFLDEQHEGPEHIAQHDNNVYTLGKIGRHNIVMATLPKGKYGTTMAATVARDMLHSFPNIRIGLMVGIGGGAPTTEHDVRLGDIVVSSQYEDQGGIFQYDFGKTIQEQTFHYTQHLNQPPQLLLAAISGLETQYEADGHQLKAQITQILEKKPRLYKKYSRPPAASDKLYQPNIIHGDPLQSCDQVCGHGLNHLVHRLDRSEEDDDPVIHYGLIASANQLMKDARIRDKLAAEKGVLCFEMEAAGLMDHFPCIVIRGICDYSDTHKNEEWQGYAAMTAAAYAKELLRQIPPNKVEAERRISKTLNIVERKIDDITSDRHIEKMKDWLCPPDPSTNINHARKLRHEGTGAWLLDKSFFQSWHSGSRRHLWLYGLAGCGKTVLSTIVLDHLSKMNNRLLLNFYFDFSDIKKQTKDGMLRSLAFQMYQYKVASMVYLDALFQDHHNGHNQPSTDALSDTVYKMLLVKEKISLVLDALDESTTRNELLLWISDISSRPELHHIQLLCTSRPELEFQRRLPKLMGQDSCISIDKSAVNADIYGYVITQLAEREDFKDKNLSKNLVELIEEMVGNGADGMFRWAACQMDSLAICPSPRAIKRALDRLPKNLTETYERMLQGIPRDLRNGAVRLLQFLVHSKRPLTVLEAVEIIATEIEAEPRHFDIDSRVFDGTGVLQYCPGLITIIEATNSSTYELHLAHFSVQEYLKTQADFEYLSSSIVITQTCLTYLTDIRGTPNNIERDFPLARFAAEIWTSYATSAEGFEDVLQTILMFLNNENTFQRWSGLYRPHWHRHPNPDLPVESRLYYTCQAGLFSVTQELIIKGADVNALGGRYGNALQAASNEGHDEIVKLLLQKGADINAQGGIYGNALQAASNEGHDEIVKLLLQKGADINAQGGTYGNALQVASLRGHGKIMKLLLQKGVDINAQGGIYGNALQAASLRGHSKIVKLLLQKGADVNAQGGEYGSALQAASYQGNYEIVKLLLDKGADVNAQGGEYGNSLQAALLEGGGEIAKLLLNKGADINAEGTFGNALQAASFRDDIEIVELLLDEGADINPQNSNGNALYQASLGGSNIKIVELLLEKGVDINAQGDEYGNALQAASYEGNYEIVKLLLDKGADINAQGGEYGSALQAASFGGHSKIIKLLLQKGADIDAQGGKYGNSLQAALAKGHREIMKLLLDQGADLIACGRAFSDALFASVTNGHHELTLFLLQNVIDLSITNDEGQAFLSQAIQEGYTTAVQLLASAKAVKFTLRNRDRRTPLHLVTEDGHLVAKDSG